MFLFLDLISKNELLESMIEYNIDSLYTIFSEKDITIDILWELTDDILNNELQLNAI